MIPNVTIMTRAVMPSMTNFRGILFGGMLMEWMDEVAGITAKRFAGSEVTTVAVEQMKFLKPVPVGAFVEVSGEVVDVGNTSLRIRIRAVMDGEAPDAGWDEHCIPVAEAMFVYVALGEDGKPETVSRGGENAVAVRMR